MHLNNVLEHIPDPAHLIALAHGLLEPGGLICINVPNDFSPLQIAAMGAAGTDDWWVAPPHHLNYFDFESLTALLTRLGFEPAARTTSFPMEAFLMMGENYIGDPALGRACHNRRKKFDLAFEAAGLKETRRAFYRALAEAGLGREAVVIAVKPMSARAVLHRLVAAVPAPPCCTRRCRAVPGVEMHHEYMVQITQPLAVRRYLGLIERRRSRARASLKPMARAIRYSEAQHWGDSSNKLSWLIPDLAAAVSRRALRPSGARRTQGGEFLFPQAGRGVLRRPLHRHPAGAL